MLDLPPPTQSPPELSHFSARESQPKPSCWVGGKIQVSWSREFLDLSAPTAAILVAESPGVNGWTWKHEGIGSSWKGPGNGKKFKKLLQLQTSDDFLKWIVDAKRSNKNDFLLCSLEFYGTLAWDFQTKGFKVLPDIFFETTYPQILWGMDDMCMCACLCVSCPSQKARLADICPFGPSRCNHKQYSRL